MNLKQTIRRVLKEEDYSPAGKEIIPNNIVIHKSNPMFRDKIKEDGLKVRAGECYKIYVGYGTKCRPAIFATNSTNKRAWFDSTYDDDIWEINTEMIPDVKWYKDRHYESRSKHIVTFQDIPKEAITLKYEGTGSGDVKLWNKDSPNIVKESIRRILRESKFESGIFDSHNPLYMEAWLEIGDEDIETYEDYGIDRIQSIIDEVKELEFPLRIYRGIDTSDIKGKHDLVSNPKYDNVSWSTSRYVAEGFGNVVYTGIVENMDDINLEYTIYRRVLHKPLDENEIVMKDNRLIKNIKRFK